MARTGLKIGSSQDLFQPARFSPVYGALTVKVFMLLFSFSFSTDCRSLNIENENNSMDTSMQKFDHRRLKYGSIGTKNEFWSAVIKVRAPEVLLY